MLHLFLVISVEYDVGAAEMDCLHQVTAVVILDVEGRRIFAKYYNDVATGQPGRWASVDAQIAFERALHSKARAVQPAGNDETVLLYEGSAIVYSLDPEVSYFIVGPGDENELVLSAVLSCIYEGTQQVLKTSQPLDKRQLLESYETLLLVVDETVDDGIVFETSATNVAAEVAPFAVSETQVADGAKKALRGFKGFLERNV